MFIRQDVIRGVAMWLQKGDARKPTLVVVHALFGMQIGTPYLPHLPDDMPVVAFQAPELVEDVAFGSIRERANYYRGILVSLLEGRTRIVHIFGASFGGPVAFELAVSLEDSPLNCESLCLADPTPFSTPIIQKINALRYRAGCYDTCFMLFMQKTTNFKYGVEV